MNKQFITTIDLDDLLSSFRSIVREELQKQKPIEAKAKEKLLSRKQAADFLNISLTTLWSWSKSGIVESHRINRSIRYKKSELDQALKTINTGNKVSS
jgi:excisionase family DNA binding protein